MGSFDRPAGEPDSANDEAESRRRIAAGGLPLAAERRLRELGEGGRTTFTSDLSVPEFALGRLAGLRPLSQVMGSSVYQVGWQPMTMGAWSNLGSSEELRILSRAWNEARANALSRLDQEARLAGADAVVGVHIRRGEHDWAAQAIEYVVVGTAVRVPNADRGAAPVLTDLSLQDYWKLTQAGFRPLGIVGATTVFYVAASWANRSSNWAFAPNRELTDFTQGVYDARETVLRHLTNQAESLAAGGVVGVQLEESSELRERGGNSGVRDLVVTLHALGTAIAEAPAPRVPPIKAIVHQGAPQT